MLLELNISDFAIIDRLNLRLGEGFNVLTGETGAGKSIIIDALGTLRGDRTDPTFVRAGAERARIEGIFSAADRSDVIPLLQEYGLWDSEDDTIILSREIHGASGRSVARVNGRAINSSVLREIGSRLVDIHGQHEGLSLFNVRTHQDMLDRYGLLVPLREQVTAKVADVRRVQEELAQLRKVAAHRAERIEELRFLLEDVQSAKLRPGEEAELVEERQRVQNGARITDLVVTAYGLLYDGDESGRTPTRPMIEAMGAVCDALTELARLDSSLTNAAEQSHEVLYTLEDLAAQVRAYRDSMEFDQSRLDQIEDRLTLIQDMKRKYHGAIEEILQRAESAETEIERLTHSDEYMADLEAREQRLRSELAVLALDLSQKRRSIGERLSTAVSESMRDLAMPNVRFQVQVEYVTDPKGLVVETDAGQRRVAFDKTGIDRVEFLLSPNPGEPLKPLAKIASGGESARLLLALKSILSRVDEVPTLVFDEVDVGVGGRAGQVVGEKLWGISAHHQVVCITHLAQVAAFGDTHYHIAKQIHGSDQGNDLRTRTALIQLDEAKRAEELAAMLDGTPVSEHSLRSAQEMLDRARTLKHKFTQSAQQQELLVT